MWQVPYRWIITFTVDSSWPACCSISQSWWSEAFRREKIRVTLEHTNNPKYWLLSIRLYIWIIIHFILIHFIVILFELKQRHKHRCGYRTRQRSSWQMFHTVSSVLLHCSDSEEPSALSCVEEVLPGPTVATGNDQHGKTFQDIVSLQDLCHFFPMTYK